MMDAAAKDLFLRYCPRIFKDKMDPFPVRLIGCTAFTEPQRSESFPKWFIDPEAEGAAMILEYAIYYDYDIQHLYDLEHIWVALDGEGTVVDCWCSFHGMRLRAAGISTFSMDGDHPILYAQPGKHAMLPHPELFLLHPQYHTACNANAGGGLLIPGMLEDRLASSPEIDEKVTAYIRNRFAFTPSMEFVPEIIGENQFVTWEQMLAEIPGFIERQLHTIDCDRDC